MTLASECDGIIGTNEENLENAPDQEPAETVEESSPVVEEVTQPSPESEDHPESAPASTSPERSARQHSCRNFSGQSSFSLSLRQFPNIPVFGDGLQILWMQTLQKPHGLLRRGLRVLDQRDLC